MIINSINSTPFQSRSLKRKLAVKNYAKSNEGAILANSAESLIKRVERYEVPKFGRFVNVIQAFPTKKTNITGYLSIMADRDDVNKRQLIACVQHKNHPEITQLRLGKKLNNDQLIVILKKIQNEPETFEQIYDKLTQILEDGLAKTKRTF